MIEFLRGLFLSIGFSVSTCGIIFGAVMTVIKISRNHERRVSHDKRVIELLEAINSNTQIKP
jgi:hypothetical protein